MSSHDETRALPSAADESAVRREAIAWVIRLGNERLSPEDRRAFEGWLGRSPLHAEAFKSVADVWRDPQLHQAAVLAAKQVERCLHAATKPAIFSRWGARAAAAAACITLLAFFSSQFDVAINLQSDYKTGTGERRTVELPDRSLVTLNTRSALALSFDGTTRRVRLLKGEALFQVHHDPARPFIVESPHAATRAVGTAFVVRSDADRDQVSVLEGIVEVGVRGGDGVRERVTAGFQIRMEAGLVEQPAPLDTATAGAWVRGRLVVNDVSFAQVLEELRRYYPGTILLLNQEVGDTRVTGTYDVDDSAGALALLVETLPVQMIGFADHLAILF